MHYIQPIITLNKKEKSIMASYQPEISLEEDMIIKMLSETGCITKKQVEFMIPYHTESAIDMILKALNRKRYIAQIDQNIITLFGSPQLYNKTMIDMIWVLFAEAVNKENIETVRYLSNPDRLMYIKDKTQMFTLFFVSLSSKPQIKMLQADYNTYYKDMKEGYRYIFVVDDEKTLDMLAEMDIQMPHKVALVTGNGSENRPEISIYE